jgi:CRP-like cAMP-binding protein
MFTEWIDRLRGNALFAHIDADELNRMLTCLRPRVTRYRKNEIITAGGSDYDGMGIVIAGEVLVTRENAAGDRLIMQKLKAGSLFGETFAFAGVDAWPVTIVAATDCVIGLMTSDKIVGSCPNMCVGHRTMIRNMLGIVSKKAVDLNRNIRYLAMKSIREKICAYLLDQSALFGSASFDIPFNRDELAEYLSVSRPSLSRELGYMRDEGLLDFHRSSFVIRDPAVLRQYGD